MSVRVKNRELLFDVYSSTIFTSDVFSVNPGLSTAFPWLSAVAGNFQEYRFHSLKFVYESRAADIMQTPTSGTGEGTVIMAMEYNASVFNPYVINGTVTRYVDIPGYFTTKQSMENSAGCISCKPQESAVFEVQLNDRKRLPLSSRYVRQTFQQASSDMRVYDMGIFQISTVGAPGGGAFVGTLYAEYDVTLLKPTYTCIPGGMDIFSFSAGNTSISNLFGTGGYQYGLDRSSLGGVAVGSNTSDVYSGSNNCAYVFPPTARAGVYCIKWSIQTDSSVPVSPGSPQYSLVTFAPSNITAFNTANGLEPFQILQPDPNDVVSTSGGFTNYRMTTMSVVTYVYFNGSSVQSSNRLANAVGIHFLGSGSLPGVIKGVFLIVEETSGALIVNGSLPPQTA